MASPLRTTVDRSLKKCILKNVYLQVEFLGDMGGGGTCEMAYRGDRYQVVMSRQGQTTFAKGKPTRFICFKLPTTSHEAFMTSSTATTGIGIYCM